MGVSVCSGGGEGGGEDRFSHIPLWIIQLREEWIKVFREKKNRRVKKIRFQIYFILFLQDVVG